MSNLLKEQITNKKILQILLVAGTLCFVIEYGQSGLGEEQDSVSVSANYQEHDGVICREVPEGYELILYNKENEEVFSAVYPCEPWIVNITEEVLEIGVSTGSPSRYVFYFDRQNSKISETFFNPILFDNMYVAYMEGNKLKLEDIFSEGILYEEITRDYSKMADPISAVDSIEILESGEILLQYYKGDDMELVSEIIEESNYLTVDWTDFEILMGHSIEPEDSGRGWEFSIADVDFDGTLELLVTFAANHCGQNALYIYKQENGRVFSFADTNAVFGKYVMSDIDYKAISPYMDIDLLAAYKNQNNEYRYLSLDYSIFGGNERGDIGTVTLYETILDKQTAPVKLAEISYVLPEETVEMYFRGERIYDTEELKDQLDEYMEGYTELEIKYETATKSFSRDIVAQSDEYKAKELVELYKSLEELFAGCGGGDDSVLDFREQKKEMAIYAEADHLKERVRLEIIDVPKPECAYVSAWTVYDEMVYYEADYIDYLTDHEGKGAIEPTSEHYTKVMSYDIQSGDTKILYQAEDIIEITDLCTDGKILIWEEYPRRENMSWRIKMLSLTEKDSVAETIFSDGDTEGELWDIIPNLAEQKIYWYDQDDLEKNGHPIKLYSYDIIRKEIKLEKEGLDLASPYEQISIIDGKICTYEMHAPDGAKQKYFKTGSIYIEDREKDGKITLLTPSKIMHPVANDKFCIWGESYESDDELWLYDYQSGPLECISLEEMGGKFAYMLLDDLIILSTRNGIWCIEPETQTYTNLLLFGEEYFYGNIWHTLDGSACMQIDSSEEKISIAKINMMLFLRK